MQSIIFQGMLLAIKVETQLTVHHRCSMFTIFLMSHGNARDVICGTDNNPVQLATVRRLLSQQNFPSMKGKPKVIIVQACSGGKIVHASRYIMFILFLLAW